MAFREIIIVPVWEDHHLVHPGWMEAVGYPASLPLPGQPTQKYTHTNHVSSLIFFCKKGGTMIMMMMVMILMIIMMMMMVMILMIIIMMMMMMMVEGEWLLFLFFFDRAFFRSHMLVFEGVYPQNESETCNNKNFRLTFQTPGEKVFGPQKHTQKAPSQEVFERLGITDNEHRCFNHLCIWNLQNSIDLPENRPPKNL